MHSGAFNYHKLTHKEGEQFLCEICGERFIGMEILLLHKLIHTVEQHIFGEIFLIHVPLLRIFQDFITRGTCTTSGTCNEALWVTARVPLRRNTLTES